MIELINTCCDEPFTKGRAASAVQHDNPPQAAGTCFKHPQFWDAGAAEELRLERMQQAGCGLSGLKNLLDRRASFLIA